MNIKEIGNNKYVINDEQIFAPNIATAISRYEDANPDLIVEKTIECSPEEIYHLQSQYREELSKENL